jgi:hypothetical protein
VPLSVVLTATVSVQRQLYDESAPKVRVPEGVAVALGHKSN